MTLNDPWFRVSGLWGARLANPCKKRTGNPIRARKRKKSLDMHPLSLVVIGLGIIGQAHRSAASTYVAHRWAAKNGNRLCEWATEGGHVKGKEAERRFISIGQFSPCACIPAIGKPSGIWHQGTSYWRQCSDGVQLEGKCVRRESEAR